MAPDEHEMGILRQLHSASIEMCSGQHPPHWSSLHNGDSLLQHGETMLREQCALDSKTRLRRVMTSEGDESPMRKYVARNIRARLREEKERDEQHQGSTDQVEIQQRTINIRKHLGLMSDLRRELQVLKRAAQGEIKTDTPKAPPMPPGESQLIDLGVLLKS